MNSKNIKIIGTISALLILIGGIYYFVYARPSTHSTKNINNDVDKTVTKGEFKIVAFGDSLTAGYGVDLKDSYPSILENILNTDSKYRSYNLIFKVINMGVSGETTSGGLDRVDFVLEQKPDLVLVGLGGNDMLRNTDHILVMNNLDTVVQKFVSNKAPIVLLGMRSTIANGLQYKTAFDSIYPKLEKKYKVPLVPFFLDGVALVSKLNINDGIHPNRQGYEKIINENILPVLDSNIKKMIK